MPSAPHNTATAAADLSLYPTAPAYNTIASAYASGSPKSTAAGLTGNLTHSNTPSQHVPLAAEADIDEQIYDVPDVVTGTKAKARYENLIFSPDNVVVAVLSSLHTLAECIALHLRHP